MDFRQVYDLHGVTIVTPCKSSVNRMSGNGSDRQRMRKRECMHIFRAVHIADMERMPGE